MMPVNSSAMNLQDAGPPGSADDETDPAFRHRGQMKWVLQVDSLS